MECVEGSPRSPADGRLLRRVYTTFYRGDWPWHAGIVAVLLVNLGAYSWVAGRSGGSPRSPSPAPALVSCR